MASPGPSTSRVAAELTLALFVFFGGLLVAGWWLTTVLALPPLLRPPLDFLGWLVAAGSFGSLAYSARVLSVQGRGTPYPRRPPKSLVTSGPFGRVRNPIFLSWGGLLFGLGLALRLTGLILVLAPAAVAIHLYVVYHEEPILAIRFGREFEDYRRRVPRWIPRLRT